MELERLKYKALQSWPRCTTAYITAVRRSALCARSEAAKNEDAGSSGFVPKTAGRRVLSEMEQVANAAVLEKFEPYYLAELTAAAGGWTPLHLRWTATAIHTATLPGSAAVREALGVACTVNVTLYVRLQALDRKATDDPFA
jgi:hypothetical protein